jgi:hypothetical protein
MLLATLDGNRNNRNRGRSNWSPGAATKFVTAMVQDVLQLEVKKEPKELVISCWKPPNVDLVKVNTDGAFDGKKCQGGTGVVIRDARGCLISIFSTLKMVCSYGRCAHV